MSPERYTGAVARPTGHLLALATLIGAPCLAAAETPTEVLAKVDAAATRARDVTLDLALRTAGADGAESRRTLRVWQKGARRLVKVLEPARLRGVGVLAAEDAATLLLYLPASGKVRRISGRTRGDTFAGSGMRFDDLTRVALASEYRVEALPAATVADGPPASTHHALVLTPRDPERFSHRQVRLFTTRDTHLVTRADFVDARGGLQRRIELSDVRPVDGHHLAHRIEVDDREHRRKTTVVVSKARFDRGLADDFFGRRQLERAP